MDTFLSRLWLLWGKKSSIYCLSTMGAYFSSNFCLKRGLSRFSKGITVPGSYWHFYLFRYWEPPSSFPPPPPPPGRLSGVIFHIIWSYKACRILSSLFIWQTQHVTNLLKIPTTCYGLLYSYPPSLSFETKSNVSLYVIKWHEISRFVCSLWDIIIAFQIHLSVNMLH